MDAARIKGRAEMHLADLKGDVKPRWVQGFTEDQ